jgi:hypothetical protein
MQPNLQQWLTALHIIQRYEQFAASLQNSKAVSSGFRFPDAADGEQTGGAAPFQNEADDDE